MWGTRWMARVTERGEAPHPPVLIVFNHIGARDPNRTVLRLQELTRPLWVGEPADGFSSYDRKIPIIATGLRNLREHGPNGPVFLRFGRTHMQPLRDAIGNPRRDAVLARRAERMEVQQAGSVHVRRQRFYGGSGSTRPLGRAQIFTSFGSGRRLFRPGCRPCLFDCEEHGSRG